MTDLGDKVSLLIGVSSPMGASAAKVLASAGSRVALCDWLPDKAESLAAEIVAQGGRAAPYSVDASKKLDLQSAIERLLEDWGRVDYLLNATAVLPGKAILEMDEWDWRRALDLNLTSAFMAIQSVGRVMRQLGGGVIINLIALPGENAQASPAYQTAANALKALSAAAGEEFSQYNIQVHALQIEANEKTMRDRVLPLCGAQVVGDS